ncbi:glycosyltransferase family 2 protein [Candidatus Uhrbacteria bacterium]|nr:glycosyltransferase family 2 protein [Candidatus Uhrbacteria bacterium]
MSSDISIIIPTYQHASTLTACLDSVLAQTLPPAEIIVVDDGSTDNTRTVLAPYKAKGVIIIEQTNQGSNRARNVGFDRTKSPYVLFLDADIVMKPGMLEKLLRVLKSDATAAYAYSGFRFGWKQFKSFPFSRERLRKMNYVHTSALIRREWFPRFDEEVKRFQDWDVWLSILQKGGRGVYVPEELFHVRVGHGRQGISSWRPSGLYRLPWKLFGWTPRSVRAYESARDAIIHKHGL